MKFITLGGDKKILVWFFYGFLIFVPLGTKKFIMAFRQPVSEFNSIFIYGSDIFLFLFLGWFCFLVYRRFLPPLKIDKTTVLLLIFLGFAFLSVFFSAYKLLAFYQLSRLFLMILLALVVGFLLKQKILNFQSILAIIAASAVFQSLIAIFQFKFFQSLGWRWLGEPVVNIFTESVARFRFDNLIFLRSFGTMPHANILASFLILGLMAFYYFWLRNKKFIFRIFIVSSLFLLYLALLFTFSRSGWIAATLITIFTILWGLFHKNYRQNTLFLLGVVLVIIFLLLVNFGWLILPRAHLSATEPSVRYRWLYNEIGGEIIKNNPFGVGIGHQLFYAYHNNLYQAAGITRAINWQPVHNIYLLIASEIGVFGLLTFLVFIFKLFVSYRKFNNLESVISYLLLITFLLFGLVDHFPWTLQNGRLMFWLIIGMVLGNSFVLVAQKDRARASGARDPSSSLGKDTIIKNLKVIF